MQIRNFQHVKRANIVSSLGGLQRVLYGTYNYTATMRLRLNVDSRQLCITVNMFPFYQPPEHFQFHTILHTITRSVKLVLMEIVWNYFKYFMKFISRWYIYASKVVVGVCVHRSFSSLLDMVLKFSTELCETLLNIVNYSSSVQFISHNVQRDV